MDVSKQTSEDASCAGVTMYLSFESNSTMSNDAFKTLEAMNDFSEIGLNQTGSLDDSHLNNTLEAFDELTTVKKMEQIPLSTAHPRVFKILNQNGLQEYKATSSTPTKVQMWSKIFNNSRSTYFGAQFKKADELETEEEKENLFVDSEDSKLSSSIEIVTSVIEKKPTTTLLIGEMEENLQIEKAEVHNIKAETAENSKIGQTSKDALRITKNSKVKNFRKPICEPNLFTNRPSRIANNITKRDSLISSARPSGLQDVSDIPSLMNKMLKISNALRNDEIIDADPNKEKIQIKKQLLPDAAETQCKPLVPSTSGIKGRNSLLPQAEKRAFPFNRRISIVKTTLNSPASKISRKSLLSKGQLNGNKPRKSSFTASYNGRRTIAPVLSSVKESKKIVEPMSMINRQSLLPKTAIKPINSKYTPSVLLKEIETQPTTTESKAVLIKKCEFVYNCNICSCQFRIKSLLEAHKRSHEIDNTSETVLKKVSTQSVAALGTLASISTKNSTQCKYCDKKFAIVRALHIHLMQNCSKIPPIEKRKLEYTEMDHVEKAQLPEVFSNSSSSIPNNYKKINSNSQKLTAEDGSRPAPVSSKMAPPQSKLKTKAAHSGVYRTPSKNVPCHLCKQSFKSILDYTKHTMALHSSGREEKTQVSKNHSVAV